MTLDEQRIALAKWAGWKINPIWPQTETHAVYKRGDEICTTAELPDYLNDLNAVHELEKKLTGSQVLRYADELNRATKCFKHVTPVIMCMATAPQRCEALLKTLGLWIENKEIK